MRTCSNAELINEYTQTIHQLALRALNGDDVSRAIDSTINEAYYYLVTLMGNDSTTNFLAFRNKLQLVADSVHENCHEYKRAINYAVVLATIEGAMN